MPVSWFADSVTRLPGATCVHTQDAVCRDPFRIWPGSEAILCLANRRAGEAECAAKLQQEGVHLANTGRVRLTRLFRY